MNQFFFTKTNHFSPAPSPQTQERIAAPCAGKNFSSSHSQIAFRQINTISNLEAFKPEWERLFAKCHDHRLIFQSFQWNWLWCRHYMQRNESTSSLSIIVGSCAGETVLIWPLVCEKKHGLRLLKWMGEPVSQYGDILLDPDFDTEAALAQSWAYISREIKPDLTLLRKVREDSTALPAIKRQNAAKTMCLVAPYIDMSESADFETFYEANYTAKLRKNRRRHRRRLSEIGDIRTQHVTDPKQLEIELAHLVELKQDWLRKRGLVSQAFAEPIIQDFFLDALTQAQDQSQNQAQNQTQGQGDLTCELTKLCVDQKVAAYELGLRSFERYAVHITTYDPEFERHSPGSLLLEERLRKCADQGIKYCDLMAPGDAYKYSWTQKNHPVCDYAISHSVMGKLYITLYLNMLRPFLKTAQNRLPASLRQLSATLYKKIKTV